MFYSVILCSLNVIIVSSDLGTEGVSTLGGNVQAHVSFAHTVLLLLFSRATVCAF